VVYLVSESDFRNRDVVGTRDFTRDQLEFIFDKTVEVKTNPNTFKDKLKGKEVTLIFFEPSTRTYNSFLTAANMLGCTTVGFQDPSFSSYGGKGESLYDTIKMFSSYSDCIIMRHPAMGSAKFAAEISNKPIINGGSGSQEHPTQTMLDMFTIREKFGKIDGLTVGMIGDLKYSRTTSSLSYALTNYNVKIIFIAPDFLQVRPEVEAYVKQKNVNFMKTRELSSAINELDVLYVTRIQKERFSDPDEHKKTKGFYQVNSDSIKGCKDSLVILHPLPRVDELSTSIDTTKHALYFQQAENGKYLRVALLSLMLGG